MSFQQQIDDQQQVQNYLEKKNVHEIMHNMIEQLLINQPNDPVNWMLSFLKRSDKKRIFLIGPPGLSLYGIAQKAIKQKIKVNFSTFNTGEYCVQNKTQIPPESIEKIKCSRMIEDNATNDKIVKAISSFCNKEDYSLVEGFPKSLKQALALHKEGICPDKVIFVNVKRELLIDLCAKKIKQNDESLAQNKVSELAENAAQQYLLNIKDLKLYFPSYLEIDGGAQIRQSEINLQIQRSLNLKFGSLQPRKNTKIVVIGAPCSGRTYLGKKLAEKYGLIYVSTAVLISEQIRRGTVIGRKLKDLFLKNETIDSFQVEKLIEERISKKDCQMQGFVLEGYPKNKQQWDNMKNLHIYPNFIIGLNPTEQSLKQHQYTRKCNDFQKRYDRWRKLYEQSLKQKQQIYWINTNQDLENYFEEACFEIQNHKL